MLSNPDNLITRFLASRRQGISSETVRFYQGYLNLSSEIIGTDITALDINAFLNRLNCSNGGKHAYYRTLRTFYRWFYSPSSGMGLNPSDNPILLVDSPKVERKILPSLTLEQVDYLIEQVETIRDKAIISLFADSGLRLSELASINPENINWEERLIRVTYIK